MNNEKTMFWSQSISILQNYPGKKDMLRVFVNRVVKKDILNYEGGSNTILMELQNDELHSWYLSAYSTSGYQIMGLARGTHGEEEEN